jgi:translation initiation factor eIF-2B subunit delta
MYGFEIWKFLHGQVHKVFLGAAALLNNGSLLSRVGTAVVAMMANIYRISILLPLHFFF